MQLAKMSIDPQNLIELAADAVETAKKNIGFGKIGVVHAWFQYSEKACYKTAQEIVLHPDSNPSLHI